jgi:hypothetical protein
VSEHIEFFVARNDAAAAKVHRQGPRRAFTTVSAAFFDADVCSIIRNSGVSAGSARQDFRDDFRGADRRARTASHEACHLV